MLLDKRIQLLNGCGKKVFFLYTFDFDIEIMTDELGEVIDYSGCSHSKMEKLYDKHIKKS